ncbi:hypothetical protein KR093_007002, partial [Drosophila rubida]
ILGHVTFTNLKCLSKNKTLIAFQQCQIKAVNRTHKYISVHINNFSRNIFNFSVSMRSILSMSLFLFFRFVFLSLMQINIKALRFDHGYKPFFFDITFDACKYLKDPKNAMVNLFFKAVRQASNLNHSCPYNHDIIVDKLWTGNLEDEFLNYLPIPVGEYCIIFSTFAFKMEYMSVHVFLHLT